MMTSASENPGKKVNYSKAIFLSVSAGACHVVALVMYMIIPPHIPPWNMIATLCDLWVFVYM